MVPEILYDPSLYLSPHIFLLAVLVKNRALEEEDLNDDPRKIFDLKPAAEANELPLLIKDEWKDIPLFRQPVRSQRGYVMSEVRPLTQSITGKWIKSVGQRLGFKNNTISYHLRYGAANVLDKSSKTLNVLHVCYVLC